MGLGKSSYVEIKSKNCRKVHMVANIDVNSQQMVAFTFALSSVALGDAILVDEVGLVVPISGIK